MKIATYAKGKPAPDLLAEFGNEVSNSIAAIRVGVVGMGSRDYVSNAILDGQATHLQRHVPGFRAVIDTWKDMGVDVDHHEDSIKRLSFVNQDALGFNISVLVGGACREPAENVEQRRICGNLQIEIIKAVHKYPGATDEGRRPKNVLPGLLVAAEAH